MTIRISSILNRDEKLVRLTVAEKYKLRAKTKTNKAENRYWLDRASEAEGIDPYAPKQRAKVVFPPGFRNRKAKRAAAAKRNKLNKRVSSVVKRSLLLQAFETSRQSAGSLISRIIGSTERTEKEEKKRQADLELSLFRKEENRLIKAGVLPKQKNK